MSTSCIRCTGQGFHSKKGGRWAAGVAPCRPPAGSAKAPWQDTAQLSSQVSGTFLKTPDMQRNEGKKPKESSMNTKVRKKRQGRMCSRHPWILPCSLWRRRRWRRYPHHGLGRSSHQTRWEFPEGPTQDQEKIVM